MDGAAVAGMSAMPVLVALYGGSDSPFLVSGALRAGLALANLVFLAVSHRDLLWERSV